LSYRLYSTISRATSQCLTELRLIDLPASMATDAGLMRLLAALPETASAKNLRSLAIECFGAPGGESAPTSASAAVAAPATLVAAFAAAAGASTAASAASAEGMDDAVCGADCVTDAALRLIARQCARLERLSLAGARRFTEAALLRCVQQLPALTELDLSRCTQVRAGREGPPLFMCIFIYVNVLFF
jgi:hypothetical protein